jgi:hypothetical protein
MQASVGAGRPARGVEVIDISAEYVEKAKVNRHIKDCAEAGQSLRQSQGGIL